MQDIPLNQISYYLRKVYRDSDPDYGYLSWVKDFTLSEILHLCDFTASYLFSYIILLFFQIRHFRTYTHRRWNGAYVYQSQIAHTCFKILLLFESQLVYTFAAYFTVMIIRASRQLVFAFDCDILPRSSLQIKSKRYPQCCSEFSLCYHKACTVQSKSVSGSTQYCSAS